MKKLFILAIGLFLVSLFTLIYIETLASLTASLISQPFKPIGNLHDIYERKLQTPLFTGFITLGSFLLTLKTFVIVKLKESLYDSEEYKKRLKRQRLLKPDLSAYNSLNNLATFLIYTVILALVTAAAQMTIGFLQYNLASAICISLAIATLTLVVVAWWLIKANLSDLFGIWEEESNRPEIPSTPATQA